MLYVLHRLFSLYSQRCNIIFFRPTQTLLQLTLFVLYLFHFFQVAYHTPPRFPEEIIQCIRKGAALLFKCLGLRDFARIDGWFLPSPPPMLRTNENAFGHTGSGTVVYTDINLVCKDFHNPWFLFIFISTSLFVPQSL